MKKFTAEDFTEFEDGDYSAPSHPHWICIRGTRPGDYYARVSSSDWRDEHTGRGSTVDSESGFASIDEALQWGVDCVNDIPLRLACWALETAFAEMGEWLPLVTPFVDAARAEEREACAQIVEARVRYSRHRRAAMREVGDEALRMAREIRARSKGGAR